MPHALVENYIRERDDLLNTINVLKSTAAATGGDPTPAFSNSREQAGCRIDAIDSTTGVVGETARRTPARGQPRRGTPRRKIPSVQYRNGGELIWDCLHASWGSIHDANDQEAKRRWDRVMKRAAEHMGTTAEVTTPVAGGFGGVFVAPVVGPVIDLAPTSQPFLTGIGKQTAPNSMTFVRPRIVDPNFKTAAGVQTLQKEELNSVKFDVAIDNLNLTTVGGYLNVSQQLMSLHPSAWNIIVGQLQRRTAYAGEAAAIAELSLSTATVPLADGAGAKATIEALFEAAALVYQNTGELPTWIAYGPPGRRARAPTDLGRAVRRSPSPSRPTRWARPAWVTSTWGRSVSSRSSRRPSRPAISGSATPRPWRRTRTPSRSWRPSSRRSWVARSPSRRPMRSTARRPPRAMEPTRPRATARSASAPPPGLARPTATGPRLPRSSPVAGMGGIPPARPGPLTYDRRTT